MINDKLKKAVVYASIFLAGVAAEKGYDSLSSKPEELQLKPDIVLQNPEFRLTFTTPHEGIIENFGEEDARRLLYLMGMNYAGNLWVPGLKELIFELHEDFTRRKIEIVKEAQERSLDELIPEIPPSLQEY